MKTILEALNEIQCPVVRERAVSQWDKVVKAVDSMRMLILAFCEWDKTKESVKYWDKIDDFIIEHGNITSEQSLQFEKYLPKNYQGIKRK